MSTSPFRNQKVKLVKFREFENTVALFAHRLKFKFYSLKGRFKGTSQCLVVDRVKGNKTSETSDKTQVLSPS